MSRWSKHLVVSAAVLLVLASAVACGWLGDETMTTSPSSTVGAGEESVSELDGAQSLDAEALAGLGDRYYPQAGNGGYDVLRYDIALSCDPRKGGLEGTATIVAEALADLESFHLDLVGLQVQSVKVDGSAAEYLREGQELVIDCPEDLEVGEVFSATVTYSGEPTHLESDQGLDVGWQRQGDTVFTLGEPEGAATWYPLNDHPSDKATYVFRLTVPKPYLAVASGTLVGIEDEGEYQTFTWEMEKPMANYLASMVAGDLVLEQTVSPAGVPIRNYFDSAVTTSEREMFARTGEMIDFFSSTFGDYPFDVYGVVVPDVTMGGAMEHQTLTLFGRDAVRYLSRRSTDRAELIVAHELAHHWFGDSVTPAEWQDIWLNEGFATYASWLWAEHVRGERGLQKWLSAAIKTLSSDETPPGDPGVEELFGDSVYERGALTLHALRLTVGDDLFFDMLREWAADYAYANATTEDFIRLVEERSGNVAGFDAGRFFDAWLFQEELPELPDAE